MPGFGYGVDRRRRHGTATSAPPPASIAVLDGADVQFSVPLAVRASGGASFIVPGGVLDGTGTSYDVS